MGTVLAVGLAALVAVTAPADEVPEAAAERARAATVRVVNAGGGTHGSGGLIKRSGPHLYVLTAGHLVAGAKEVEVRITSDKASRSAVVLAAEPEVDLAVLRLAASE